MSEHLKKEVIQNYEAYGCVKCQRWHYDDEDVYYEHIWNQSKHGIRTVSREERFINFLSDMRDELSK